MVKSTRPRAAGFPAPVGAGEMMAGPPAGSNRSRHQHEQFLPNSTIHMQSSQKTFVVSSSLIPPSVLRRNKALNKLFIPTEQYSQVGIHEGNTRQSWRSPSFFHLPSWRAPHRSQHSCDEGQQFFQRNKMRALPRYNVLHPPRPLPVRHRLRRLTQALDCGADDRLA